MIQATRPRQRSSEPCPLDPLKSPSQRKSSIRTPRDTQLFYVKDPTASLAYQAIRTSSVTLRCAPTDHRCGGPLILELINQSQPTPSRESLTCSRVLLSAAIPIHTTKPVRQSLSVHIG